jgi:hypothetical protein
VVGEAVDGDVGVFVDHAGADGPADDGEAGVFGCEIAPAFEVFEGVEIGGYDAGVVLSGHCAPDGGPGADAAFELKVTGGPHRGKKLARFALRDNAVKDATEHERLPDPGSLPRRAQCSRRADCSRLGARA